MIGHKETRTLNRIMNYIKNQYNHTMNKVLRIKGNLLPRQNKIAIKAL